jgi:hypothetical protein
MLYYHNGDKNGLIAISLTKHRRIAPDSLFPKITLNNKLLALGMLIPILLLMGPTNLFAKHLSDTQRYNDGFNDGSQAALQDRQNGNTFNPACDPQGLHTSDGQHTTFYCNGWAAGYNSAWNGGQQQGTGPDWNSICIQVQSLLVQSCSDLVNSDGTLTQQGQTAVGCIRNGVLLGLGGLSQGLPLPVVIGGLKLLSNPTGCGNIVNWDAANLDQLNLLKQVFSHRG